MTRTLAALIAIAMLLGVDVGSQAGPRDVAVIVNRANPTDGLALTQGARCGRLLDPRPSLSGLRTAHRPRARTAVCRDARSIS